MAWNTCYTYINNMFGCNACEPLLGGYTGRALLVPFEYGSVEWSYRGGGEMNFGYNPSSVNYQNLKHYIIPIFDKSPNPFEGTSTAGNTESGRKLFKKTVQFVMPIVQVRGHTSFFNIFRTNNNGNGFFIILERKVVMNNINSSENALWRYEVIGRQNPLTFDGDSFSRNEYENAGAMKFTMSTTETYPNIYTFSSSTAAGNINSFNQWWNDINCMSF